ncbi:hypothetical protein [Pelomonas aquatica]|jgi:hypothetical protein|uniref:Uncharacterized protein n=1 Tax=Pelomonas aquatica TaxID=431058 RepID=A0A9X4R4Y3_9BURK|nr:hypothetical protein [Pelomonas aquatica]MCY4754671.1 hypothetical protein [Pelomonas aquatica]MDG0863757.1 hypothetical protein [Pelomonas aquatica]
MGILNAFRTGIFAARIAGCLLDLGIDVKKLDAQCAKILYEIECEKSKELSPHEAALYFFGAALPYLDPVCFTLPISSQDLAQRAEVISNQWIKAGKMRRPILEAILKTLRREM